MSLKAYLIKHNTSVLTKKKEKKEKKKRDIPFQLKECIRNRGVPVTGVANQTGSFIK